MQIKRSNEIIKKFAALNDIDKISKAIIKYGSMFFMILLALGTLLIVLNNSVLEYDSYLDFVAKSIVKISFSILAEVIIGALAIDFIMGKK